MIGAETAGAAKKSGVQNPNNHIGGGTQSPTIEMKNVSRQFGSLFAVREVSFEVGKGEVVGFIGPNGAGKTTSMRILATLDLPTSGDALIDGFSITNDPDRVRKRLGFMPDSYGSYGHMNCEEYLDFFARAYGLNGRQRVEAMRRVIDFAHLAPLAQKPVKQLSKGMKQRLCLGRALIHDPSVIVMDEPAAGLDPRARIELRQMIGRLREEDKTILISSHILSELAEMCDRIVIIEAGRLLAVGTVDEIMALGSTGPNNTETSVEIAISVLDGTHDTCEWIRRHDELELVSVDEKRICFSAPNRSEFLADLLKEMISNGFRLSSFTPRQKSLEDVFVHVTKGIVQ